MHFRNENSGLFLKFLTLENFRRVLQKFQVTETEKK